MEGDTLSDSDSSFKYEEVSVDNFDELEEDGFDGENDIDGINGIDEDLDTAIRSLQERVQASNQRNRSSRSGTSNELHLDEQNSKTNDTIDDAEYSQKVAHTRIHSSTVEDFIRNFLIKKGMHKTLDIFNTEWYEHRRTGQQNTSTHIPEEEIPDVYLQNQELEQQVNRITTDLKLAEEVASKAQSTWDQFRKERDFHRLHHKRVVQEKQRLITDLKRLRKHYEAYEPTIQELRDKYEILMKDKMLIRLERDRLKGKLSTLEKKLDQTQKKVDQLRQNNTDQPSDQKGLNQTSQSDKKSISMSTNGLRKKKKLDGPLKMEEVENPYLEEYMETPPISRFQMLQTFEAHDAAVSTLDFHPTKPVLATGSDDMSWKMWSIPDGELIMSGEGHQDWISSVKFHPQGTHLATAAGDGVVKMWDFVSASCCATFSDHTQAVWSIDFHHSGDYLASASMDHTVRLWDTETTKCRQTFRGHVDSINAVQFLPFSNHIATASGDKTISFWDARSGLCGQTFYGHNNAVNDVVFSLQGDIFASCDADGIIKVWDVRTATERATLEAGDVAVNSITFDPSGTILVATSDDGSLKVYNIAQMMPLGSLRGHSDSVQAAQFECNADFLVSGGSDHTFRVWGDIQNSNDDVVQLETDSVPEDTETNYHDDTTNQA